jgi:hypothetical protein
MLHGMSPNGIGLDSDTALLMSVIRGLMSRGLIDQAEARLWLNNAAAPIEEDKTAFKAGAKLSPLSDRNRCDC